MKRNHQIILQAVLILAIASVSVAWRVAKPGKPELTKEEIESFLTNPGGDGPLIPPKVLASRYDRLGETPIFDTIIPLPPEPPPPPPPRVRWPDIKPVMADWTVTVILSKSKAGFTNRRTRQYLELNVSQTRTFTRGKDALPVTLAKIGVRDTSATFMAPRYQDTGRLEQTDAKAMQ